MNRSTGVRRIASSRICVPSTFVVTNSDAPSSIDFSTCDSAAALTITSTPVDELGDERGVADVAVDEREPLVAHHVGEVLEVPGVGERVERDHLVPGVRQQVADHVRRDEAGAAGDENALQREGHGGRAYRGPPARCSLHASRDPEAGNLRFPASLPEQARGDACRPRLRRSQLALDRVQRAALDLALDAAEVLADEREDEPLHAEHEDHGRAEEQRAREVRLADPVRDAVDARAPWRPACRRIRARRRPTGSAAARSPRARGARGASGAAASSARRPGGRRGRRRPRSPRRRRRG